MWAWGPTAIPIASSSIRSQSHGRPGLPDTAAAQTREPQQATKGVSGAFPLRTVNLIPLPAEPAPASLTGTRSGHLTDPASPPSWYLPAAGAALGALGGVIYIAAHNKGETIVPPRRCAPAHPYRRPRRLHRGDDR